MRAITMQGGRMMLEELADPVPQEGQLLVAPIFNGICGSDLHRREQMRDEEQRHEGDKATLTKIVPGHEFCAEVIAVGPHTDTDLRTGDRVVSLPFALGSDGSVINIGLAAEWSGGLGTLSLVDAERSFRVPADIPSDLAALTEPLSVGLHAVNLANRHQAPNIILGCGPIGLAVILALRNAGRGPIVAADFSSARRDKAVELGADLVIDPRENSPYISWEGFGFAPSPPSPLLPRMFEGQPSGLNIFECTGSPAVFQEIVAHAPQHSHVIYAGVCKHEIRHIPVHAILRELAVDYCFAYTPPEFKTVLDLIGKNPELFGKLITSRLSLKDTEKAFDRLSQSVDEVKILIDVQAN